MAESHPLVDMLMHYHQNSGLMPTFRENPGEVMDQFGLDEEDKEAVFRALEGDFVGLDERLRKLLPFDEFPTQLPGWDRAMLLW